MSDTAFRATRSCFSHLLFTLCLLMSLVPIKVLLLSDRDLCNNFVFHKQRGRGADGRGRGQGW